LPQRWLPVPVAVLAALAYDPTARRAALEATDGRVPDTVAWARAARLGVEDPDLRRTALDILDIAVAGAARLPAGYLPPRPARVAVQEELWGVMKLSGTSAMREELLHMYDAFENPRAARVELPLLNRAETSAYRDQVRARVLEILEEADFDGDDPLVRDGFVY